MSKAGKKMLAGARQAVQIARKDPTVIKYAKVTPSCGCVFCDIDLAPEDGRHFVPAHSVYPDQWLHCMKRE